MGHLPQGAWTTNVGVSMTKDGDVFTAKNVTITDSGDGHGYFSFVTTLGTTGSSDEWDGVINGSDRYGAETKDAPVTVGTPSGMKAFLAGVDASAAYSWAVAPGTYDIRADFANMKMTVEPASTGVADVTASDDVETVYYNTLGIKVDKPGTGLYIVVRGNKVSKEYIR